LDIRATPPNWTCAADSLTHRGSNMARAVKLQPARPSRPERGLMPEVPST
jgi:hypothetical protein